MHTIGMIKNLNVITGTARVAQFVLGMNNAKRILFGLNAMGYLKDFPFLFFILLLE